eukprot:UN03750
MFNPDALNAATLTILIANLTGISWFYGMCTAYETLGPQALGTRNFKHVGVSAQQSVLCCFVILIFSAILWCFADPVLRLLKEPSRSSELASTALLFYIIAAVPYICYIVMQRFLWVQGIVMPVAIVTVLVAFVHPAFLYIFLG